MLRFRLKAFGLHLLASACVLTLVLGGLYLGWYRWPGWYLAGMRHVSLILTTVDVAIGPLLTLLIASPVKPRRELARDIGVIVAVQIAALLYGTTTLWQGRPLYYAFSGARVQMVQAADLTGSETALGRRQNPALAPAWYSLPRWVWAPVPDDPQVRSQILRSALSGRADVYQMPRYFKPWDLGITELRERLRKVSDQQAFTTAARDALERKMRRAGFAADQANTILLTGRAGMVLAVFDRSTMRLEGVLGPE